MISRIHAETSCLGVHTKILTLQRAMQGGSILSRSRQTGEDRNLTVHFVRGTVRVVNRRKWCSLLTFVRCTAFAPVRELEGEFPGLSRHATGIE